MRPQYSTPRRLALLQTIEALRQYSADHEGQWPTSLEGMQGLSVHNYPMTGKAFQYQSSGNRAAIKATMLEGGDAKDTLHYELTLK
ncbi:hypothetical protein ACFL6U_24840 [Planctomycetota bacterium]